MRNIFIQCFTFLILIALVNPVDSNAYSNTNLLEDEPYLFLTDTILNIDDTLRYELTDCFQTAEVCIGVPIDSLGNYQITVNGQSYVNGIAGCDFDTTNFYSYTNLFGQGNLGPYILQSWQVNASIFSTPFNNIAELVDSMNVWDPTGNWVLDTGNQLISGGTVGFTYSDMDIYVLPINAANVLGHNDNFIPNGTLLFINSGFTELLITESNTGAIDTAIILASCAQLDTTNNSVFVGSSGNECLDFSELPGPVNSVTNICGSLEINYQLINGDSCVMFSGVSIGMDTACYVACDIFGFCDTTYMIVEATEMMGTTTLFDTIFESNTGQWCIDQSIFLGTTDTIYSICAANPNPFATFAIDTMNYCVDYTGVMSPGTSQGCFIVCDDLNNCDTTFINVTVLSTGISFYYDTLYVNQSGFFCDWDASNLIGPISNITNGCIGSSGTSVLFGVDNTNFCIDYDANAVGKDTACIYLSDNGGLIDTTYAIVCVIPPDPMTIIDTIRLSNTPTYCIDTSQLAGNIVSIENICPMASGQDVSFLIDSTSFCIDASPIQLGTDSACIVICDDFGVCDTTTFIVTVQEDDNMTPPIAMDDTDSTAQNNSLVIDACFNDSIPANLNITNFFVLPVASGGVGPTNGTAFSNADCTVSYVPNDDYCGEDQITYIVCNTMGCDTATITVNVICPSADFQIFNAFSPNGDGVNEYFKINGIEQFPDHILTVFNRWGNEVLKVTDYQNDWNGRWQGLDLPDGTYFYVFERGDGNVDSGYVYIGR